MSRRAGAAPATGNALDAAIKRQRAAAVRAKTVEEFYTITQLGSTDLFAVSHPQDADRRYRVSLYDQTCNCPAFRQSTGCKHLSAVTKRTIDQRNKGDNRNELHSNDPRV